MRRNILLVEIDTNVSDRDYAILDAGHMGSGLALSLGGMQVDYLNTPTDIHRLVRGTQAISSGKGFFECAFWSGPGTEPITNNVSVGIVNASASLSQYVGENANGWGYRDGAIYHTGSSTASVATAALKDIIGVALDATAHTVSFYLNNNLLNTSTIAAGSWYPAVTVSGSTANALSAFCNFGQRGFEFPQPDYSNGWSIARSNIGVIRLASEDYMTAPGDSPPNMEYEGRIFNAESIQISNQAKVWVWTDRNDSISFSQIDIDNYDGAYDNLITNDIRNSRVTLKTVAVGSAYASSVQAGFGILDKVEAVGETIIRLTLRSALTLLDRPTQRKLFPPYVSANAQNKPFPMAFGAARTITPVLFDEQKIYYRAHDAPLTEIATVYDNADPLDPTATPPDWLTTPDQTGMQLHVLPVNGKPTADVSSSGPTVLPPGPSDVLGGDGSFTTWSGTPALPNGWTFNGPAAGDAINDLASQCAIDSNTPYVPSAFSYGAYIQTATQVLLAGRTYRWSIDVSFINGVTGTYGGSFYLLLKYDLSGAYAPISGTIGVPGHYSGTVTIPAGSDRYLYVIVSQGAPGSTTSAVFDNLIFEEIVAYVPPPLAGITLEQYFFELFQTRASFTNYSISDATALDTATGNIFGVYLSDAINVSQAARLPLDSYTATLFPDNAGDIRTGRLFDPATASDGDIRLEISADNLRPASDGSANVQIQVDTAPGLTTSMGARRNWTIFTDSEFVSDYSPITGVPAYVRAQLKRRSQFIQVSNLPLANQYRHAISAVPLDSLLDDPAQAQAEIDRVCALFGVLRFFYTFSLYLDSATVDLKFGDIVRATYPRWNLNTGAKLFVVGTVARPMTNEIDLICWG